MEFDYLWKNGPVIAKAGQFKLSTDSVLLGNFANTTGCKNGIDLGCGSGALSILIMALNDSIKMTGVEICREEADLAMLNFNENSFDERGSIITDDIRNYRNNFNSGSFDFVITNPPYFAKGSGPVSKDENRSRARGEENCSLQELIEAASYLLKYGGRFAMVHKPDRLSEIIGLMRENRIEPKRLRLVCKNTESPPSLILIEGKRGASSGISIEKNLFLFTKIGEETEELKKIYHRN